MQRLSLLVAAVLILGCSAHEFADYEGYGHQCPDRCCPTIANSDITGFSGYRGMAAVVIGWGSCTSANTGFEYIVSWGDGQRSFKELTSMGNVHEQHQYSTGGTYTVTVQYCKTSPGHTCECECCKSITRSISVGYAG